MSAHVCTALTPNSGMGQGSNIHVWFIVDLRKHYSIFAIHGVLQRSKEALLKSNRPAVPQLVRGKRDPAPQGTVP